LIGEGDDDSGVGGDDVYKRSTEPMCYESRLKGLSQETTLVLE